MSLSAYDVKIFVWRVIKESTTTCLTVSSKHPYVTSCLVFLFALYLCCPLFFWIMIYSLPLAVSTWVVLNIRDNRRCKEEREIEMEQKEREGGRKLAQCVVSEWDDHGGEEEEQEQEKGKIMKRGFSRVHSVRRRRPKEISPEDEAKSRAIEEEAEEEKKAILAMDAIDKPALVLDQESSKETGQVETEELLTNADPGADVSIDQELYKNSELVKSLKLLKDEEDARDEASKAMDANLAEAEKNERLESLIAKRRSHKTPSLQARKPSDIAAFAGPQVLAPIVLPKINTWSSPGKNAGPYSPGSAPSVLVPMRNPFDLPYDPQEEKPDLTGDSFQQEFAAGHNRDFMFCRHESFSLGPSLPMDFFEDRDDAPSIDDFGFRRRRSSMSFGYRFPKPQHEESDTAESKSNMSSPNSNDEMKEEESSISPITDNPNTNTNTNTDIDTDTDTRHNPLEELSLSPNSNSNSKSNSNSSRSSMGSSEDERPPICKINREAILKSLSMRRNSVSVPDIQENNLSYANSALENASRLKQQYLADKAPQKRHGMTFSIASDMQVEVSEISSPPLTIGENMSYQDDASEMERNASWDGLDSWAGSSRMSETTEDNDTVVVVSRPTPPIQLESQVTHSNNAEEQHAKSSEEEVVNQSSDNASANQATVDSSDPAQQGSTERLHHATISPKSVLQPTLSVASFDHEGEDEVQQSGAHPVDRSTSNAPQNSAYTVDRASQELPSEPPNASDEQQHNIRKNDEKLKGVADGSNSEMVENHEKHAQTRDESSSTSNGSADSMNEKQEIKGKDQVTEDGSSDVAESSSRSVSLLPPEKEIKDEYEESR